MRDGWLTDAACAGYPTEWWFPADGAEPPLEAQWLCQTCPVRVECNALRLNAAVDGWWAGSPVPRRNVTVCVNPRCSRAFNNRGQTKRRCCSSACATAMQVAGRAKLAAGRLVFEDPGPDDMEDVA